MDSPEPSRRAHSGRPTHPRLKAAVLMIAVVVAIVVLAAISTFGSH